MSLKRLMRNFMTVQQTSDPQDVDGSIDRSNSWINLILFTNIRCNIQEKKKEIVTDDVGNFLTEEHKDIIYHLNRDLYLLEKNPTNLRIVVNRSNPRKQLTFPIKESDVDIYEFKGHIRQVASVPKTKVFYTLKIERNNRWNL